MGALVFWAVVCGILLVLIHLLRRRFLDKSESGERRFPKPVVPAAAAVASLALCVILYRIFDEGGTSVIFDEGGMSIVENAMSTARFRNALFGIAIAVLAWLWFEGRRTGPAETGRSADVEGGKSKLRKSSELPLVLLVVVTFVAVVTSELPGIIGNFRIGFGAGGLFLEPVDPRKGDGRGFFSYSTETTNAERADLATLDHLGWLASRPPGGKGRNLMERDAHRICILVRGEEGCPAAGKILEYNDNASMTTTPVFHCMAAVAEELKDRELAGAFVRPVATAYMRAVRAGESGGAETAGEDLRRALTGFSAQLDRYGFSSNQECVRAGNVAADLAGEEGASPAKAALHRLLDLHRDLPYGHIAYAIFADFFGDAASGVLALQHWEDGRPPLAEAVDDAGEKALHVWTGYVARTFQNVLIAKIPNDLLKATMQHYDWSARRILGRFRGDFIAALDREDYCVGTSNRELMKIYRLSIQESEDELAVLLDGDRYGLLSAFSDRSVHGLAEALDGYERFKLCFKAVYASEKVVDYRHARILESLGRYKMQYASYVMRRESALHPERRPAWLCGEAVAHFESALRLLPGRSEAEALRPRTRMAGLVGSLSMEGPYPEEALRRRLVARLDVILASGGCSQW